MSLLLVAVAAGFLARPAEAGTLPFADIVDAAAERHGVDPDLVHAVIAVESAYRATAQSPAGAQGLMQLMPGTQRDLGVADAFDPRQNVDAGVACLRRLTDELGTVLALAACNAGPGAVRRYDGNPAMQGGRAPTCRPFSTAAEQSPMLGRTPNRTPPETNRSPRPRRTLPKTTHPLGTVRWAQRPGGHPADPVTLQDLSAASWDELQSPALPRPGMKLGRTGGGAGTEHALGATARLAGPPAAQDTPPDGATDDDGSSTSASSSSTCVT